MTKLRPPWLASLLLTGALCFVGAASPCAAEDLSAELKAAQQFLDIGDFAHAYEEYLKLAQTNPLAQFSLGLFHQFGWGRQIDRVAACHWQEKAAAGKIPAAQHFLAECLRHGIHRDTNLKAAAQWYDAAIRLGYIGSLCPLAELYIGGTGVPKNSGKGLALCQQAAEKGVLSAQVRLGRFYVEEGEIRDYRKGLHWFNVAANANSAEGQYNFARMLENGWGRAADIASARNWYEASAGQGYLPAYLPAARLYAQAPIDPASGLLPASDLAKAYMWSAAAEKRLQGAEQSKARTLLTKMLELMPTAWRPDLDRKIAEHLERVASFPNTLAANIPERQTGAIFGTP